MNKTTFWKSKYWLINKLIATTIGEVILIVAYFIISTYEELDTKSTLVYLLFLIIAFFMSSLPIIVGPRTYLSKFTILDNGISWYLHKKRILIFDWEDIIDVSIETRLYRKCLVFEITKHTHGFRKNEFYFNVDKRNIEVLYKLCKNESTKNKIGIFIKNKEYVTPIFIWQIK